MGCEILKRPVMLALMIDDRREETSMTGQIACPGVAHRNLAAYQRSGPLIMESFCWS